MVNGVVVKGWRVVVLMLGPATAYAPAGGGKEKEKWNGNEEERNERTKRGGIGRCCKEKKKVCFAGASVPCCLKVVKGKDGRRNGQDCRWSSDGQWACNGCQADSAETMAWRRAATDDGRHCAGGHDYQAGSPAPKHLSMHGLDAGLCITLVPERDKPVALAPAGSQHMKSTHDSLD